MNAVDAEFKKTNADALWFQEFASQYSKDEVEGFPEVRWKTQGSWLERQI